MRRRGPGLDRALGVARARRSCRPTRRRRRRARRARRSTCPSRRRSSRSGPRRDVATTRPSSPPVSNRSPSSSRAEDRAVGMSGESRPLADLDDSVREREAPARRPGRRPATMCSPASSGSDVLGQRMRRRRPSAVRPRRRETLADRSSSRSRPMNTTFEFALLAGLPFALRLAVEHHVDALENEALRVALQRDDALAAQDLRALRPGSIC